MEVQMKSKNRIQNKENDSNPIIHRYPVTSSPLSPMPVIVHRFEAIDQIQSKQLTFKSVDDLFKSLEKMSKRTTNYKKDNFLISAATFKTTTSKSHENVSHASILIIDVDGEDMSPEDFMTIFPFTKMCLFNTYTNEENRYRVIFPLSLKVTKEAYRDIVESIIAAVQNSLFQYADKSKTVKDAKKSLKHGIDRASKQIEMIYYAPCQSEDPSKSFFIVQEGATLDVLSMLRRPLHNQLLGIKEEAILADNKPLKDMSIDEATEKQILAVKQEYKLLQPGCGYRNDVFFNIAQRIWWLGVRDISRIESELVDADHDQARRKKGHIKSALKFIQKLEMQGNMRR
jgi:hypothetical protein